MACKCGKNSCSRIQSRAAANVASGCACTDVCVNPICGDPKLLSITAPLIYDEIGVNLCTTFTLGTDIATTYPTAVTASAQVLGITYTYGTDNVQIEAIAGRPNCYLVTLSNLTVSFAVNLYDSACRFVGTVYPTAVYLPSDTTAATYDEDTNPTAVALEIFAPYGISYDPATGADTTPTPALNNIGFLTTNNVIRQGLNLYAIPKILGFDLTAGTVTVGLTLVLQSLYFAGYNVASEGKIQIPKGSILSPDNSDCMKFVSGELLDLQIKPLELGLPCCEENLKEPCTQNCGGGCSQNSCNCNTGNSQNGCNCGTGCVQSCCSYFASDNSVALS